MSTQQALKHCDGLSKVLSDVKTNNQKKEHVCSECQKRVNGYREKRLFRDNG